MAGLVRRHEEGAALRRVEELGKRTEYLAFGLAGDAYAIRIELISEILRPPPITEMPRAPHAVRGVVSVRGRLVTVVDLRVRLRLRVAALDGRARMLLADHRGEAMGLLVDEVRQVYRLAEPEIEPAAVLGGEQPPYILGIGRPSDGQLLVLLDLRQVLEV
jgi:purine-binding chemotaxis protein CheW